MKKKRICFLAASILTAAVCLSPLRQSIGASATDDGFQPLTASTLNEAKLFDGSCSWVYPLANYSENEEFAIVPAFAGGMCLDYSLSNGKVQIFKLHRNYNQRWKLQKAGNYFRIVNPESGKVIAPQDSKVQSKVKAEAASLNTRLDCQLWKLDAAGDGSYFIRNKADENLVLDITGNKTDSSTPAMLFPFSGERNQRFFFEPLTAAEPMEDWGSRRRDCNGTDWDFWDGSTDTSWYYANKNDKTYFIGSGSELAGLTQLVRNGTMDFAGRNIVLTKDINLCGIEWPCIGSGTNPFRGSFLGNNHAIIGLVVTSTNNEHGLFGCVRGAIVRDLAVKGSVSGDWNTAGICGALDNGIIYNV